MKSLKRLVLGMVVGLVVVLGVGAGPSEATLEITGELPIAPTDFSGDADAYIKLGDALQSEPRKDAGWKCQIVRYMPVLFGRA